MPLNDLATPILSLPRAGKRLIVLGLDAGLCILTVWLAFYLRLGEFVALSGTLLWTALASILLALPLFVVSGLYRAIFRYSGWPALMAVTRAIAIYGVLYATVFTAISVPGVPRTVGLIQPILLLLAVGASRAFAGYWLGGLYRKHLSSASLPKVLVYGAGSAGRQLALAMSNSHEMRVVGFLDDDDRLHGHVLHGLPIYSPGDLADLAASLGISDVLLALPSIGQERRNQIIEKMLPVHVAVRTLPSMTELAQGKVSVSDLRELDIDDLLGRRPVTPNHILLAKNITHKTVLVTGAGGSIGSELCRQILKQNPAKLLLVEISEYALYSIHTELEQKSADLNDAIPIIPLLASVTDEERLREIMQAWQPATIYHAAAYKHVPLVEHNPAEGVKNNVFGTLAAAQVAVEQGVSDFVLISTDKAVRPTNIMGASKRLAEMVLQAFNADKSATTFSMVRFGNVLGSSGSVVPRFRQQIKEGGPVTVTHPEINRYFMTIPEASQLVIQSGAMASGGDVFVLDMGEPVKIMDLAHRMIELSGLAVRDDENPEGDIAIIVTGLRPGEKLYEELLIGDNPEPTRHPRILRAQDEFLPRDQLEQELRTLLVALNTNDVGLIHRILQKLVQGYQPGKEIVDWVYLEQLAQEGSPGRR